MTTILSLTLKILNQLGPEEEEGKEEEKEPEEEKDE